MAAFANVELSKDGKYRGEEYAKRDVLRMPSSEAARLVRRQNATAYTGTKKPKNLKELEEVEEEGDAK